MAEIEPLLKNTISALLQYGPGFGGLFVSILALRTSNKVAREQREMPQTLMLLDQIDGLANDTAGLTHLAQRLISDGKHEDQVKALIYNGLTRKGRYNHAAAKNRSDAILKKTNELK